MGFDPERHHRRSVRLRGYDYALPGTYFVTICAHGRECLFGHVDDGAMRLSDHGEIVAAEWRQTAIVRPYVDLDAFVVMPNHLHGIVVLTGAAPLDAPEADGRFPTARNRLHGLAPASLAAIVGQFKAAVTKRINDLHGTPVWQRNYYEHIIRDERSLDRIRAYIAANPARWHLDEENPAAGIGR